jgi:hypothetical protein
MTVKWPTKDPDEILDFGIDWTLRLDGDTIATTTWSASTPSGLTRTATQVTGNITTAFFSGGTEGTTYAVTCTITTTGGRTMQETGSLKIKSR